MSTILSSYMKQANKHPVLTREEEYEVAKMAKTGDKKAREKLIVSNLRFVVQVANKFKSYTNAGKYTIMDLVQEGNAGLVHAFDKFDPESGNRFTTYAVHWIRARIMQFIINSHSMVKLGTTADQRRLFFKLGKLREINESHNSDEKFELRQKLAKELDMTMENIKKMEDRFSWNDISADKPVKDGENKHQPLIEFLESDAFNKDVEQENYIEGIRSVLNEAMKEMSDREKYIIENRWLCNEPKTLQAIGKDFNLSRERIRQIEAKAFEKLRSQLNDDVAAQQIVSEL